jgi:surface protein
MKSLTTYIVEKMVYTKSTASKAKYFPKDRDELKAIIIDHLKNENGDLTDIDVSEVDNFNGLFRRLATPPIRDIVEIDVTGWDTSKVTTMGRMFFGCFKLKKIKGIEDWDISNVESMRSMFYNCEKLQLDLSSWKIKPECAIEKIAYNTEYIKLPKAISI